MMTSIPAASAVLAASSLRTPSCIHTTLAPIAIASSTTPGASSDGAEHVDHVDLVGDVAERGVDRSPSRVLPAMRRIDRDHAIAFALQVLHHEVAGPVPVRRGADHCDRLHPLEDRADFGVGIGKWARDRPCGALRLGKRAHLSAKAAQASGALPAPSPSGPTRRPFGIDRPGGDTTALASSDAIHKGAHDHVEKSISSPSVQGRRDRRRGPGGRACVTSIRGSRLSGHHGACSRRAPEAFGALQQATPTKGGHPEHAMD